MTEATLTSRLLDLGAEGAGYAQTLSAVAVAVKRTAAIVSRGLSLVAPDRRGRPGDWTRHLRRQATEILLDQVRGVPQLAAVSIAGVPQIYLISSGPTARYLLLVEALHRQSLLSENQSIGLAYSILERPSQLDACAVGDFLQPGRQQVCAGLAVYGPSTMMALTIGDGVDGFTLDRDVGNFVLTHPKMRIPADQHIFAINASDSPRWQPAIRRYVDECVQGSDGPRGHDFVMRWNASAVIGVYRTLVRGGLFLVPDTDPRAKVWGVPLLHNAAPLSWIIEQAGGAATNGAIRLLNVVPDSLTSRTPLICGDEQEVFRIERYHNETEDEATSSYPLFHSRTLFVE